jgi:drug/metabolite transporter (DMT)-like permease
VGYLFALLGALLFGANGSLAKLLVEGGLTATQLTLFRSLGTAILAGLVLLATDRSAFRLPPRQLLVMAVLGVGGVALVQATYAAALTYLPVGVTLLLQYTAVLIVALVAFLFFHEKVRPRLWVAIGLVLLGLGAVARPWEARLDPTGVALAAVAAVTLAFYFLVGERQVGRTSPLAVAFWTMIFASVFWGIFSAWWELDLGTFSRPLDVGGQWGSWEVPLGIPLLVTVVVGSFLAFLLSFSALKHLSATAAGIVASAEVVFAFAVAWVWLGETLDPVGIAGATVVLAGILLAQTARRKATIVDAEMVLPAAPGVGGRT